MSVYRRDRASSTLVSRRTVRSFVACILVRDTTGPYGKSQPATTAANLKNSHIGVGSTRGSLECLHLAAQFRNPVGVSWHRLLDHRRLSHAMRMERSGCPARIASLRRSYLLTPRLIFRTHMWLLQRPTGQCSSSAVKGTASLRKSTWLSHKHALQVAVHWESLWVGTGRNLMGTQETVDLQVTPMVIKPASSLRI